MCKTHVMHVSQRGDNLSEEMPRLRLWQALLFDDVIEELAARAILRSFRISLIEHLDRFYLHHNEILCACLYPLIQSTDVLMTQRLQSGQFGCNTRKIVLEFVIRQRSNNAFYD